MLPELINHIIGTETQAVHGRDIHAKLEIGRDYTNWVKDQIKIADLVENVDFMVYDLKGVNPQGGRPRSEYTFTLDAAKDIFTRSIRRKIKAQSHIYFIYAKSSGLTKIGMSTNPEERIKALECACGFRLKFKMLFSGDRESVSKQESAMHESFSHKRRLGEWFKLSETDLIDAKAAILSKGFISLSDSETSKAR